MMRPLRRIVAALALGTALSAHANLERPFGFHRAADAFDTEPSFRIGPVPLVSAPLFVGTPTLDSAPFGIVTRSRVLDKGTARFTGAFLLGVIGTGYVIWWKDNQGRFSFTDEGWFGEETYAGGADKASHIIVSYIGQQMLEEAYLRLGHGEEDARWLSVGAVAAAGLIVEAGDGFSFYGAAWQDVAANLVGALFSSEVSRLGLRDTIGMRFGRVKTMYPDPCCRGGIHVGSDYGREIYSLDVKLAGLLPRMKVNPGPARFLLVSITYGSKGYRFSPETHWERNIGMDIGLNLPEILRALGVRDDSWWGRPLLFALSSFRIPYTAFGFRYDLNHSTWSGWDTGDRFDPGSVIYDRPR